MTGTIRVLVADDQRVIREGLGALLACSMASKWSAPPPTARKPSNWPPNYTRTWS